MPEKTINHFLSLKLGDAFWSLSASERQAFFKDFSAVIQQPDLCVNFYQISPLHAEVDFLIWSAAPLSDSSDEMKFFEHLGRAVNQRRPFLQPVSALWGYTRPSVYSRAPSAQEIDPLNGPRQPYLVMYPFVKTVQWYLLGKDTRQGMMNEHIRIGHQYPEIKQLLLYSFGVQDQEFVVVYEMENLFRFHELVNELRGSDVREYTQRDTPISTGIWRSAQDLSAIFGGKEGAA
jgi:chlorite dismutase